MYKPGAKRLRQMLARNHAVAGEILHDDFPLNCFNTLQKWQHARISRSFADLIEQDGYRPACVFFLSEVYGGLRFRERDQDMSRVMPAMIRFLPDRALMTMSEAFELQAISLEYDVAMATYMAEETIENLDMPRYCEVYRARSERSGRERQILLIRKLGYDLEKLVSKPLVSYLVRLMRGPAHAAGFGKLQEFLESGLNSFRALVDTEYFIETIYEREWNAMQRMFDGDELPFGFRKI
jgi:hypothetical protein